MSSFLRRMADRFPRIAYSLTYLWRSWDAAKPWNWGRVLAAKRACAESRVRARREKQLVFVSEIPRIREAKLARALRSRGWEVILLCRDVPGFDVPAHFDAMRRYTNRWEALTIAAEYAPEAYHVFACWNYHTAAAFVQCRPGKIVLDPTDVLAGLTRPSFLASRYPGQEGLERYCLEHADGLCCRSLETQYVKRALGYRFEGRRVFFPDLVQSAGVGAGPVEPTDEIHVVQAGGISFERLHPEMKDNHYYRIAEALTRDGVHFHLYSPTPSKDADFEAVFAEYLELARRSPYMHVHRTVPLPTLLEEMRRYTFGLHVAGERLNFGRSEDPLMTNLRPRFDYSLSNRDFDYLAAGLPVIVHDGRFQSWLVSRLGLGFIPDAGFLSSPKEWLLRRKPDDAQRRKLERAPASVDIVPQLPRLERFYRALDRR